MEQNTSENPISEQWSELICRLSEVYSANVNISPDGTPLEIHVLASDKKSSKSIVRDVQSALSARFGVNIDYHIISVAQIGSEMLEQKAMLRFKHSGTDIKISDGKLDVTVTLSADGGDYKGSASGSTAVYSRRVCLAEATLGAIAAFESAPKFVFGGIQTARFGELTAVLVQVDCPESNQTLLGSAFIGADADASVIKATLNAVNRRVSLLP